MTRGMDVEGVKNVINYDMPAFIKTYIHRAGRTARAGQSGRCFTLLRKDEVFCDQAVTIQFCCFRDFIGVLCLSLRFLTYSKLIKNQSIN